LRDIEVELVSIKYLLGLPEGLELPRTKATYRNDKRNYREILLDEDRKAIADMFKDEVGLMGHER